MTNSASGEEGAARGLQTVRDELQTKADARFDPSGFEEGLSSAVLQA